MSVMVPATSLNAIDEAAFVTAVEESVLAELAAVNESGSVSFLTVPILSAAVFVALTGEEILGAAWALGFTGRE